MNKAMATKTRGDSASSGRRGSALAVSLLVIAIISGIGVGLIQLQASLERRQAGAADRRQALYIAEAGLAEATLAVSQGRSGRVGTEEVPARFGGDSVYWVESEDLAGGRILLTAHAAAGTSRFSIQAMVLPNVSPVGEYGFFGDERVEVGFGAVLDGYDSNEGSYASQLDPSLPFPSTGQGVEIYSNGDIIIASSPTVPPPSGSEGASGGGTAGASGAAAPPPPSTVSTPLWDKIATGNVDPNWDPSSYMIVAENLLGRPATVTPSSSTTEYLELLQAVDSGAISEQQAEATLGLTNFRAVPNIVAGVDLAYGTVSSTEIAKFETVPISIAEYIYLLQHKANGLSLEQIEGAYTQMTTGVAPEPSGPEPSAPSEPPLVAASAPLAASESTAGAGTFIFGATVPGPDSYVATNGDAFIEESAAPSKEDLQMPRVVVPGNLRIDAGAGNIPAGEVLTLTAEDVWMDAVTVPAGSTLVLMGPMTLGVATLDVALMGSVVFDDSLGPVRLYVTDRLDMQPGSLISSPAAHEDAFGTHVFVGGRAGSTPGDRVNIAASGEFHGVLYAPEDDLLIPNTLRFFGAAAGKRLFVQDYALASYDRAFATEGAGVPSLPKILSWQIVPIEEGELRSLRFDPVATLRMRGIEPIASANAAVETDFEATYLDTAGNLHTYTGPAASFNWSDVGRLTSLRWLSATTGQPLRWSLPAGYDPQQLVAGFRADERMRIYGTAVPAHPAGADAALAAADAFHASAPSLGVDAAPSAAADAAPSPVAAASAAPAPASAMAARPNASLSASVGVEPLGVMASITADVAPPAPALSTAEQINIALADAATPSITGLALIGVAVDVLRGTPRDLNGDGTATQFGVALEGSSLTLTVPDSLDAASLADFAALAKAFDLKQTTDTTFGAGVGGLAPLIQSVIDSASGAPSSAARMPSFASALGGLGG